MKLTKSILIASCSGLLLAGCQSTNWGQVAAGTGLVLAGTGAAATVDPKVAEAGRKIAEYCPILRIAAVAGAMVSNDRVRAVALQAGAAVNEICDKPITDSEAALIVLARAYDAARAARITSPPS